jgi:heme a synthase
LVPDYQRAADPPLRRFTGWLIAITFIQLIFGALMAGHKAATAAPTWPTINGDWVPPSLFSDAPWLFNFIDNKTTIHFVHRGLAYLLLALTIIWTIKAFRRPGATGLFIRTRWVPLALVLVQVLLGITSLFASRDIVPGRWAAFEWLAQLHQVTGMLFVLSFVHMYFLLRKIRFG